MNFEKEHKMADIGEPRREVTFEPMPDFAPLEAPVPAPAAPEPEPALVPA